MADRPPPFLTLKEAVELCPNRPHWSTIWRWCVDGSGTRSGKTVYLRYIKTGKTAFTRPEWLEAFFDELAVANRRMPRDVTEAPTRSERTAQALAGRALAPRSPRRNLRDTPGRAHARALAALASDGI